MNCKLSKSHEFEGIRSNYRQCNSNSGELAIIVSAGVISKPIESDGIRTETSEAAAGMSVFSPPIPKGLYPPAQGCEARATLGHPGKTVLNPNGVAASTRAVEHQF
jgi:hypothetical protein